MPLVLPSSIIDLTKPQHSRFRCSAFASSATAFFTMLFALLAGGLPIVAAMATNMVHQRAAPSVLVSLFVDKTTNSSSVMVTDKAKTKIYGHRCADTLALG